MKYINIKTRAIVDSPFAIYGDNWKEYTDEIIEEDIEKEEVEKIEEEIKEEKEIEEKSSDEITKKEIMAELDALGIEYNPKARKDELYKLMMGE
ncbi:hypothetical protein HMPREF3224_01550 [Anaerococcus hydrogenalis]|nr:hypothetical protein HMPREF3224_01550 [Anaerococcus hydrogenalis]